MKLTSLKPGMTVYDCHSYRMGNTLMHSLGVWSVRIVSVDPDKQSVVASWNGNSPRIYYRREWSRWTLKEPVLVECGFGRKRRATKQERTNNNPSPTTP